MDGYTLLNKVIVMNKFRPNSSSITIQVGSLSSCGPLIDNVQLYQNTIIDYMQSLNGDFEVAQSYFSSSAITNNTAAFQWWNYWNSQGPVQLYTNDVLKAQSGNWSMGLYSTQSFVLSQSINYLNVNQAYQLSFYYTGSPQCSSKISTGFYSIDFRNYSLSFNSSATSGWVSLINLDSSDFEFVCANFRVNHN